MASSKTLLSLPQELLILLPNFLHNIEDFTNLASTCRTTRAAMKAATPRQILHLAIASSDVFFRPSPQFLVVATARELGQWARSSLVNEKEFASKLEEGVEGMLDLAKQHCGLTMARIRKLYELRFSIINPVANIMDQSVGQQWYQTENFWIGGVSDAYTIASDPEKSVFQLAIYGELFGPGFNTFLDQQNGNHTRMLSVDTRLEFVKYCIPDVATIECQTSAIGVQLPDGSMDPRRFTKRTGPYQSDDHMDVNDKLALYWILKSSRWRPHWQTVRAAAGGDFGEIRDEYFMTEGDWRQRMWEACLVTQGLEGLGMMQPELRDSWVDRVRAWRATVEKIEDEPHEVPVGINFTYEYPWLSGDIRVLISGYAGS